MPSDPGRESDRAGRLDVEEVEARLVALEQESDRRRAAIRERLDDLPAALSRRALVSAAVTDLRAAPDKGAIVNRGLRKIGRIPGALWRRIRSRFPG